MGKTAPPPQGSLLLYLAGNSFCPATPCNGPSPAVRRAEGGAGGTWPRGRSVWLPSSKPERISSFAAIACLQNNVPVTLPFQDQAHYLLRGKASLVDHRVQHISQKGCVPGQSERIAATSLTTPTPLARLSPLPNPPRLVLLKTPPGAGRPRYRIIKTLSKRSEAKASPSTW